MKKRPFTKKLKIAFWLIILAGGLWVGFMPHTRVVVAPNAVTVHVQQPPEPPQQFGGEEQPTPPHPIQGNGETVTVPVVPVEETPPPTPTSHPRIAIVIDDVGVDLKGSDRAIKLPPAITLSFLPYGTRLREQTKEARDRGHELLLHMPMEPLGHEDPGPGALLVDLPLRDLQQRFETALASFTGFDGVNNHMGSKFTAYADGMNMVIDELQQRHLFFLDSRTSAQTIGKKIAEQKGLPSIGRDVFLDDDQSPEAVHAQLEATERVALKKSYAVAIGHPHTATLEVMEKWIPEAQKRGFVFVPLKSLVKQ